MTVFALSLYFLDCQKQLCHTLKPLKQDCGKYSSQYYSCSALRGGGGGNSGFSERGEVGVRRTTYVKECSLAESRFYAEGSVSYRFTEYLAVLSACLSPRHGTSSGCGWRYGLQLWWVPANTLNKQSRTADKG
jgi:hypothetical protein